MSGWDHRWSAGFFITIATHHRRLILGHVTDGVVHLSALGLVAEEEWLRSAVRRPGIELDAHVIMPNHLHGIVWIHSNTHEGLPKGG